MNKLLMVMVLGASAVAASAQSLQPRRTLGSRLARPTQTVSQTADATKDREARKARAAQRPQFSAGSSTTEFDRECETLFMDIVREAEICQTNLAMYATYPYWPDAMGVVSNFCEKENCVVVDVGHHFGSWKQGSWWQGCGKKAYVAHCNLETRKRFVPQGCLVSVKDGFRVVSRGGSYTNVAYCNVGSICCYDSDGRFVELYDSLDKIPGMKQCFDDELKVNYGKQDQWMKAHGFGEEGSGREAENRLDAARTNVIGRLNSLRTILSTFSQWQSDNKWHRVCDVGAGMGDPSAYGELSRSRPLLGGLRRPGSKPSINIDTNDEVLVRVNERFECLGCKQDKLIETVVRDLTGLEFGVSANTNGMLDLKFNLCSYETCTFGTNQGDVNSVTLIAEFEPSCEQKTIHEKLDMSLSTLLSAIGMDRNALAYEVSLNGARPLVGLRRPAGNQDWKSVQSFSRRFTISRNKQQSGQYVVTISDQKKVAAPTATDNARQSGLLGGGTLRARRLQRQQEAEAAAAKQREEQAAKDAERQAQAELERKQRAAERAEQRQQLLKIQEELKRVREAKAAATRDEGDKVAASCATSKQTVPSVLKEDFKAKLTGIAIIEGGRMCGYESRALKADFVNPDSSIEIPYGKAACFRVEYDFPEGYQARVWISDKWQKGEDGCSYYFGSNPSPLYKGKGIAYGFLHMLERGKTCTLKQLAIHTNSEPKLECLSGEWDIAVTPVHIKFYGPETVLKSVAKDVEKTAANNQANGKNVVAQKLQGCDFLLNKGFKKNAKVYLCLFSASWCGPCRAEMPRIAKAYAETLKDDPDIELIHFSRDQNDEKALAWAKEHDVKFPVVKPKGGNPLDLHSRGIPHLFIVKADGTLLEEGHPMRIFNEEKFREIKRGSVTSRSESSSNFACRQIENTVKQQATVDGYTWTYSINKGEATIEVLNANRYDRCAVSPYPTGHLVIPSTLGGARVTCLGSSALYRCKELTSVTIPKSVTSIGSFALFGCSGLTSVTIPASVTSIGSSAFNWCSGLTTIVVEADNPRYKSIDNCLLSKNGVTLIRGSGSRCVEIPKGVTSIGENAFFGCSGLASVTIPASVTSIEKAAFYSCHGLMSVTIPSSVTSIGEVAFGFCGGLTTIVVDVDNPRYKSIDNCLFSKDGVTLIRGPGSSSVVIPKDLTSIGDHAFSGCKGLTSVTIPSSVTSIGSRVFSDCTGLESVTMRGERPDVEDEAFARCDKLVAIHVPVNAKSWAGMKEWQGIPLVFDGGEDKNENKNTFPKMHNGMPVASAF